MKERKENIKKLWSAINDHKDELLDALMKDLGKPEPEALLQEIFPLKKEVDHVLKNLNEWLSKRYAPTPISLIGTSHYVKPEPKGHVLIISPWNFPVMLTLRPLIGALAAGNTVVLKPSEHTPNTSEVIQKLIKSAFDENLVKVVLGGPEEAANLTSQDFDHINFTGGTEIGKLVMKAASEKLCSVTLELGGKSPAIVDCTANIKRSVKRIAWGKYLNAGQVCIAPDYLLIQKIKEDEFVKLFEKSIINMYGEKPIESNDLGKIVNTKHFNRITALIEDAISKGASLHVPGGVLELGEEKCKISPCFLTNCSTDMAIMKEEIFGPVLPIMTWETKKEALSIINKNPNPLALYIFSSKRKEIDFFVSKTKAGSTGINEVIIQAANPSLGFGGIGTSGIGRLNGKESFDSFSNLRSFVASTKIPSALPLTFPPFTKLSLDLSRFISKWL